MKNIADVDRTAKVYKSEILNGWEGLYREKRRRLYEVLSRYWVGDAALELGIADGESTRYIVERFEHVEVVDASDEFIGSIKERFPGILAHQCYFEQFSPDRKFSSIFMTHILEHLDDPLVLLNRAYEWLEEDGVALISVPNALSLHRLVGVKMGLLDTPYSLNDQDIKLGHRRVFDRQSMADLVADTKFSIKHFTGLMLKPLSNRQIQRDWDDKIVDAFFQVGFDFPELCSEIIFVLGKQQ